ncbi:MAG: hypothetical protein EBR28_00830, partial [Planctomycetia bacterium]|nr:hypothetical protein [Planctomycetia bacterium]
MKFFPIPLVIVVAGLFASGLFARAAEPAPIRVVIWDERQPEQKQAYDTFLGDEIATRLSG